METPRTAKIGTLPHSSAAEKPLSINRENKFHDPPPPRRFCVYVSMTPLYVYTREGVEREGSMTERGEEERVEQS